MARRNRIDPNTSPYLDDYLPEQIMDDTPRLEDLIAPQTGQEFFAGGDNLSDFPIKSAGKGSDVTNMSKYRKKGPDEVIYDHYANPDGSINQEMLNDASTRDQNAVKRHLNRLKRKGGQYREVTGVGSQNRVLTEALKDPRVKKTMKGKFDKGKVKKQLKEIWNPSFSRTPEQARKAREQNIQKGRDLVGMEKVRPGSLGSDGFIPPSGGMSGAADFYPRLGRKIARGIESGADALVEGISSIPGDDWGMALGKGMAALGDALVQGGRGKTGFLGGVLGLEEKRRQEPFERMKEFNKMLMTEVRAEENKLSRQLLEKRYAPQITKAEMEISNAKENTPQGQRLWKQMQKATYLPAKIQRYFKNNPYNGMSVDQIQLITRTKFPKVSKGNPKGPFTKIAGNKTYRSKIKSFTGYSDEEIDNLPNKDAQQLIKAVDAETKRVGKRDLTRKEAREVREVGENIQLFLKYLAEGTGHPKLAWEDLTFSPSGDKIFVLDQNGKKVEIDPPGVKLLGGSLIGWLPDQLQRAKRWAGLAKGAPRGTEMISVYEKIFMPIRKMNFGASQSAMELQKFARGEFQTGGANEGQMIKNIKTLAQKYARYVEERNEAVKASPIGEHILREENMLTPEDITGGVVSSGREAAKILYDSFKDQKRRGIKKPLAPYWSRSLAQNIQEYNNLGRGPKRYYDNDKRSPTYGQIIRIDDRRKTRDQQRRIRNGTLKKPENWGWGAVMKFLQRLPDSVNWGNKRILFKELDR